MTRSRLLAVIFVAVLAGVASRIAAPAPAHQAKLQAAFACGVERWKVKTLQDRPHLLRTRSTTVAHLVRLPRPAHLPPSRLRSERHLYRVVAAVTLVRREADQDVHLVLRSGSQHMIAEAPNAPFCTAHATAYRKKQMRTARRRVRLCARARVVGVAFWDYKHGQTGVAPNGIELHPILKFSCLRKSKPPPPPPPSGRCAASYPDECIPPPPPELNCGDIPYRNFRVRWNVANPDPQGFDGDRDGIGCET